MTSSAGAIAANRAMAARGATSPRLPRQYVTLTIAPDPSDDHARKRDRWCLWGRTTTGSYSIAWARPLADVHISAARIQRRTLAAYGTTPAIEVAA